MKINGFLSSLFDDDTLTSFSFLRQSLCKVFLQKTFIKFQYRSCFLTFLLLLQNYRVITVLKLNWECWKHLTLRFGPSSCCFMQPFSCYFMVPQSDLRSERSRYMSRHLDQTGPNVTVGNPSGFYQTEEEAGVPALSLSSSAPHTLLSVSACRGSSGVTRPNPVPSSLCRALLPGLLLLASSSHAQTPFSI